MGKKGTPKVQCSAIPTFAKLRSTPVITLRLACYTFANLCAISVGSRHGTRSHNHRVEC